MFTFEDARKYKMLIMQALPVLGVGKMLLIKAPPLCERAFLDERAAPRTAAMDTFR